VFESVTKRRKNPIINIFGWTLLTVVCVVFVFIGFSPNSSFLGSGGAAAEVNGDAISLRDYKELLDRLENNNQGGNDSEARRRTQDNAINILVSRSLIVQEAKDLNIHVSDNEVGQALLDIEPFYEEGVFSRLRYKTYLRQARLTESEFEDKIRRDLIIQKMSNLIGFAAKDLSIMDEFDDKIDQAQINIGYVVLNSDNIKLSNNISLNEFIKNNEAKIKEYYEAHKSEFASQEEVKARHILIKAKDDKPASMDEALAKVKNILKDLKVSNFSEMAKKFSEDTGSKDSGGQLGFFPRGRMVPEFEKAAFTGEVGKISEPVKTQYGYHVILVDEKKGASEKSLDEVKQSIASKIKKSEIFDGFLSKIKENLKSKNFNEVENLLKENQLNWESTGFFSITKENIPGIGENKEFLDLAMGLNVENEYAEQLVYKGDTSYLLKFKGAKLDKTNIANNQMDFFKQLMKQQKMNMLVQNWTDSLRENASIKINKDLVR
jgi:peptidyl-prolyl cis-trans isomerase D